VKLSIRGFINIGAKTGMRRIAGWKNKEQRQKGGIND
jgi:hypothetical protein